MAGVGALLNLASAAVVSVFSWAGVRWVIGVPPPASSPPAASTAAPSLQSPTPDPRAPGAPADAAR